MRWDYTQPVEIRFGEGRVDELPALASERGWKHGLLVAAPHVVKSGLAAKLEASGCVAGIYANISPNPDVSEVDACADQLAQGDFDFVVAIGGGSAIDLAKAASATCGIEGSVRDYLGTGRPLPDTRLPLVAVPTTAGTGSEVTSVAVISDRERGTKAPIVADSLFPEVAVVDPQLTWSVPPQVTASTGIDVLCHAIEGYWSLGHQPICDALAVHAARIVFTYLPRAVRDGADHEARERLCEASVIAGLAFALPKTTSSHACSFPLTRRYGIPHGEACGLTLDYFCRLNASADDGRVKDLAHALGFTSPKVLADGIAWLRTAVGLRSDLTSLNLTSEDIDWLVQESHHPNLLNNPVPVTDEALYRLYRGLASGSTCSDL